MNAILSILQLEQKGNEGVEEEPPNEAFELATIMTDLQTLKAKIEEQIQAGDNCEALTPFSILQPFAFIHFILYYF